MHLGNRSVLALIVSCLAVGAGLGTAVGQMTPPTQDSPGISRQRGPEMDLGPELPGYKLRLTVTTFQPGTTRAIHGHHDNPEITYILEGQLTEFRKDGSVKSFGPGSMRANGRDVEHWMENRGPSKMVQVVASVVKSK